MDSREQPIRVNFTDTVQINIIPARNPSAQPRWDDPPSDPYGSGTAADSYGHTSPSRQRGNEAPEFQQIFLKAKPKLRGVIQIFMAQLQLAFGIALMFIARRNYVWFSYISFWGPPVLIVSGSLAIFANSIPSCKLVLACFLLHFISWSVSFAGLTLCCADLFKLYPCGSRCPYGNVGSFAIISFLLMSNVTQMSSSSYITIYGYRSLRFISKNTAQTPPVEDTSVISPDPPAYAEVSTPLPASYYNAVLLNAPTLLHPPESPGPQVFPDRPVSPPPPAYAQLSSFPPTGDRAPPPPYCE